MTCTCWPGGCSGSGRGPEEGGHGGKGGNPPCRGPCRKRTTGGKPRPTRPRGYWKDVEDVRREIEAFDAGEATPGSSEGGRPRGPSGLVRLWPAEVNLP